MPDDRVLIPCAALDHVAVFQSFDSRRYGDDDWPTVHVGITVDVYYARQVSLLARLWERAKLIWAILRGKEYQLEEVTIVESQAMQQIADFFQRSVAMTKVWEERYEAEQAKRKVEEAAT